MKSIHLLLPALFLALAGCGTPSFLITPVQNTNALQIEVVRPGSLFADRIAIIEVEGMLMNARSGGLLQPTENKLSLFTQQLEAAESDSSVKAIVLRINSPGGTVTTADTMYQQLIDFRARTHKPVVASIQDLGASGAYYVACGADKIVATPTSLVGSIGVIFSVFNVQGTMGMLGVTQETFKSGPMKDIGSPFVQVTPEQRKIMQGMVDEFYARFTGIVRLHRNIADADFPIATDGRVFSGVVAQKMGLVDQVGSLDQAIQLATDLAHANKPAVILYKRPYGYSGSIYASSDLPAPASASSNANTMKLELPQGSWNLPTGFYYLWQP